MECTLFAFKIPNKILFIINLLDKTSPHDINRTFFSSSWRRSQWLSSSS